MSKAQLKKFFKSRKKYFKKLPSKKVIVSGFVLVIVFTILYFLKGIFFAAFVNGQPISRISVIRDLERQGGAQALDSLISQTLISQEAKKQNVNISKEEIDTIISEIEANLGSQGGLNQALASEGMTRNDLVNQIRIQQLAKKMLADKISVTQDEVNQYIETNKEILPEGTTPDELNKMAKSQLEQQKLSTEIQSWLTDLKQKANINYFVKY